MTARPAMPSQPQLHWSDAAFHWDRYGPPLRPAPEDIRAMEALVRGMPAPRVLMLGVTPEIATMGWPAGTRLHAVDRSRPMLERVWPGDLAHRSSERGDWLELRWGEVRYDVIIGDGIFPLLAYPGECRALVAGIRRGLADGGIFVTRQFLQAPRREAPAAVFADLLGKRIGSFDAFKMRLAMAMQDDAATGVRVGDVFAAWEDAPIDRGALLAATGWPSGTLETIRPWAGKDARLAFASEEEMASLMGEVFDALPPRVGRYELAERCPVVGYRPRPQG